MRIVTVTIDCPYRYNETKDQDAAEDRDFLIRGMVEAKLPASSFASIPERMDFGDIELTMPDTLAVALMIALSDPEPGKQRPKVKGIKDCYYAPVDEIYGLLSRIETAVQRLETVDSVFDTNLPDSVGPASGQLNSHTGTHLTGNVLTQYNELMLCEDACTDAMQKHIDEEGWRIVVVCPQSSRRPDYIMGRYNPNRDHTNSAYGRALRG